MQTIDLTDVLGWGYSDVEFLNNRIEEFNLNTDLIKEEIDSIGMDLVDINSWIYCCYYLGANNFLNKVLDYANDNDLSYEADRVDIEVFCNYLDSFLNGKYLNSDIDITDYSDNNLKNFIDLVKNT